MLSRELRSPGLAGWTALIVARRGRNSLLGGDGHELPNPADFGRFRDRRLCSPSVAGSLARLLPIRSNPNWRFGFRDRSGGWCFLSKGSQLGTLRFDAFS